MEQYLWILKNSPLFYGVNEDELLTLLKCTGAETAQYEDGESVCRMGEALNRLMLLLSGKLEVVREDFWGNSHILSVVREGEVFGEAYSCSRTAILPVSIRACGLSQVLSLDYQRMLTFCSLACEFHGRLIQNLLRLMAQENVKLKNQLEHMSRRTIREKLLSYLSEQALSQGSRSFDIPCSRQELALYLGTDRSAMSSELGKLRAEGLLDFKRNHFELHSKPSYAAIGILQ